MLIDKKDIRSTLKKARNAYTYGQADTVMCRDGKYFNPKDLDFCSGDVDVQLFYQEHPYDGHDYVDLSARSFYEALVLIDKKRVPFLEVTPDPERPDRKFIDLGLLMEDRQLISQLHRQMKKADWYYDYSDDHCEWRKGQAALSEIKHNLLLLSQSDYGRPKANQLWDLYVPAYSEVKPSFLQSHLNATVMNEKNLEFLQKQVQFTGYGKEHNNELREELKKQNPSFTLYHQQDFGKDSTVSSLHFKKSESSDMYFFNRHTIVLKNEQHPDTVRQGFYINNGKDNITLKEGFNLLSGRAVEKDLENKEGEKYRAWIQLNFKEIDKQGNFETRQFHQRYGFDLEKVVGNLPIKSLGNLEEKKQLMESLQRGNRQAVTLEVNGAERKAFIEAAPQFKALNYYNDHGKRMHLSSLLQSPEKVLEEKQTKQEVKHDSKHKKEKTEKSEGDDPPAQKKTRRNKQKIHGNR